MKRFFVSPESINGEDVLLTGGVVHRITRVLRMSPGDKVILLDGSGAEFLVVLLSIGRDIVSGRVFDASKDSNEPKVHITLYQAILKGDKLDWVLQKGTELGITRFVPLICERSVPKGQLENNSRRMARWGKVMMEAAEQSGRSRVPDLIPPTTFDAACQLVDRSSLGLIPWEEAKGPSLKELLMHRPIHWETRPSSVHVNLFIGPEGGFQKGEVEYAQTWEIIPITLGKRILRSETAGLVAASAILYETGDLG